MRSICMSMIKQQHINEKKIRVTLPENLTKQEGLIVHFSSNVLITAFLFLALTFTLLNMFDFSNVSPYIILTGFLPIIIFNYITKTGKHIYLLYGLIVVFCVFIIIFNKYTINGLFLSLNHIADIFGNHTHHLLPKYALSIDSSKYIMALNFFWLCITIMLSLFISFIVQRKISSIIWILVIGLFIFQLITQITPSFYHNLSLFVAMIVAVNTSFIHRKHEGKSLKDFQSTVSFMISLILIIIFSIAVFTLLFLMPVSDYEKPSIVLNIKTIFIDKYNDLRFEKKRTHSLTEGNFTKLGKLELNDSEALEVIMSEPNSYYLRGFVGAEYTQSGWKDLSYSQMYENYNLFYWLHKEGVTPLSQLSLVNELGGNKAEKTNEVTINNINANSKYIYTPYEFNDNFENDSHIRYFKENHFQSIQFFGQRNYTYEASSNLVKHYPAIANRLYQSNENEEVKQYIENEAHYNKF